jgi:anti-sigma B factor antagonist
MEVYVETTIGVFDSREKAEQAVKELIQHEIPEKSIVFLTSSESEAMAFGKDLGAYAGGFLGGAVGVTAGCVGAAIALIPGFGQVFALGVGGAALLGYLGSKAGGSIAKGIAETEEPGKPKAAPLESSEEAGHLLEVLKSGRSVVLVQTELHDVAAAATSTLNRLGLPAQAASTSASGSSTRESEGVTIVDFRGRIAFGSGNTQLRETVANLVAGGKRKVLLNLKEVDFVDSSGIGEMVKGHMALRKNGGQLKLCSLTKTVSDLLQATSLNKIFDIHPDEASAVKAFSGSSMGASAN